MSINKNRYGQYFTKEVIADFMVSLITHSCDSSVLEPSCGLGVFLNSLEKRGFGNLSAYEIDSTLPVQRDYLKFNSFLSVPTTEKYDVVIGNPPYIRWKNLEKELKDELTNNPLWNKYFNSLCDYLFIFILKSIEHLNEEGELIFICSEYWLNTTNSLSLRNYMCDNGYISDIYHFKEAPLFDNVTASLIIFRFVKSTKKQDSINFFMYADKGCPSLTDLLSLSCFTQSQIPQFEKGKRWMLATKKTQDTIAVFEQSCSFSNTLFASQIHQIGEYCDIGNGMVSGLDKAFAVSDDTNLNDKEKSALISVLKAKNLSQYLYVDTVKYIFMPQGITIEEFNENYPNFASHFKPFISDLSKRYSYNREIPYWEFVFPRNYNLFSRKEDKIFVPCKERISNKDHFRFCLAPKGFYPLQDVTGIVKKSTCKDDIRYILAFLNSEYVFEWLKYNGIVKGAIVEFSEAPISSIPYRPINWNAKNEVDIHNTIVDEVSAFESDKDKQHILTINQLIYRLLYE